MKYKQGYKYQLYKNEVFQTYIKPKMMIKTEYITLTPQGLLIIEKGYAWDGPSGPTFDTKSFMRGSLAHDAFYQMLREGHLPQAWRRDADRELVNICKEDGMWKVRAWWVYKGVRMFAASAASKDNVKKVLTAP